MRKILAVCVAMVLGLGLFTGCDKQEYQDGTYRAEYAGYDRRGFKDYIVVTVQDGEVTALDYDGLDENGGLKSEDEEFRTQMEAVQNNYPAQVRSTLINQYLVVQDINKVDVVAGATYSTESFVALFKALEANIYSGDTGTLVVDNIQEK